MLRFRHRPFQQSNLVMRWRLLKHGSSHNLVGSLCSPDLFWSSSHHADFQPLALESSPSSYLKSHGTQPSLESAAIRIIYKLMAITPLQWRSTWWKLHQLNCAVVLVGGEINVRTSLEMIQWVTITERNIIQGVEIEASWYWPGFVPKISIIHLVKNCVYIS